MSRLAAVSDRLRGFQRETKQLDDSLGAIADRELAHLRQHFQLLAQNGDERARQHAALLAAVERQLRDSRAQLQLGAAHAQRWLVAHAADGTHTDAHGGAVELPTALEGAPAGDPSEAIYALVHRANAERIENASTDATMAELARLMERLTSDGERRYEFAAAWQGDRRAGRNDYDARLRDPDGDTTYVVSGPEGHLFQFETDGRGNTIRARTTLNALRQPRAERLQREAKERKGGDADDDGGHLIANTFGGPGEAVNVVPQDWFENQRGEWRWLEREWRRLLRAGCEVEVEITPQYADGGQRPTALVVRWAFRARGAPSPFEWVKDTVVIGNAHATGPRQGRTIRR